LARIKCPVEEIGRNSVNPSTTPRMIACSSVMERRSSLRRYVLSPWRRATGGSYLQHPGMISFSTDLVDPSCSRYASLRATVRHPCCPLDRAGRMAWRTLRHLMSHGAVPGSVSVTMAARPVLPDVPPIRPSNLNEQLTK